MESELKFGWIGEASAGLISHNGNQMTEIVAAWIFALSGGETRGFTSPLVKFTRNCQFNVANQDFVYLSLGFKAQTGRAENFATVDVTSNRPQNNFCQNKAVEVKTLAFYVTTCPRFGFRVNPKTNAIRKDMIQPDHKRGNKFSNLFIWSAARFPSDDYRRVCVLAGVESSAKRVSISEHAAKYWLTV